MGKTATIAAVGLGLLTVLTIVIFGLSIGILIKVNNNKTPNGPVAPTEPTKVPPTEKPVTTGSTTTGTQPTGGSTGSTGTSPAISTHTGDISTQPAGSTSDAPTSQPTVKPADFYVYSGQFTDVGELWTDLLSDPDSQSYKDLTRKYSKSIQDALKSSTSATSRSNGMYDSAIVTVRSFSPKRLINSTAAVIVSFAVKLFTKSDGETIRKDIDKGRKTLNYDWRSPSVGTAELPELPEPSKTPGWKSAANMFLKSINISVDPCVDFFAFSCDRYIQEHPLNGTGRSSTFDELQTMAFVNLTNSLDAMSNNTGSKALDMLKNVYVACENARKDTYNGAKAILDITEFYGGWPLLKNDTWNPSAMSSMDVFEMIGDMYSRYGVPTLFQPQVNIDWRDPTGRHILFLDQAVLAVPAPYYKNPNLTLPFQESLRETIYDTVHHISTQAGITVANKTLLADIESMIRIELDLAYISVGAADLRDQTALYNPYNVSMAQQQFPNINWTSYFDGLFLSVNKPWLPVAAVEPFIIIEPRSYVKDLNNWLQDMTKNETRLRDLVNYLIFRAVSPYMPFAGVDSDTVAKLARREAGIGDIVDTKKQHCTAFLVQYLPYAAGRMYIDKSFDTQPDRDSVSVMISGILSSFSGGLNGLPWMDDQSRLGAFGKVKGLVQNVAFPDFQQNDAQLDDYYKEAIEMTNAVQPTDKLLFFDYVRALVMFNTRLQLEQLNKTGNRLEFLMSPAVVNAWYQPERNSITFPAAILNEPFYRYDFPQAVNYGGLGVVMGHELTHGFDDEGVQYDSVGKLNTWMSGSSQKGFKNMSQCVVDEYSRFCYPQACIDGVHTQGENIADNGGLKAAYRAYKLWSEANGEEKALPNMEAYTMDQIFFMSFAHVWCGSYSDATLTRQLLTNEHSPGRDRVIGAMRNFPKFAEAFSCEKGDPMYPPDSCNVW